jgi:hypothetical protein
LTDCVRRAITTLREQWQKQRPRQISAKEALGLAAHMTIAEAGLLLNPSLKRVINGTGVILHTG